MLDYAYDLAIMFGPKSEKDVQSGDEHDGTSDVMPQTNDDTQVYPSGMKLALIMGSIYIAMFLVALVRPT